MRSSYAPSWTEAEREAWTREYLADEPVEQPMAEHEEGECHHCDLLRELIDKAAGREGEL